MPNQIIEIERTFGALLKKQIPQFEKVQPSLITILKAYSETNLSNLLGYLFRGDDHLLLKQIFLRTLIDHFDLPDEFPPDEDIEQYLSEVKVDIEYATKFGRIDILIRRDHPTKSKRWAIIVENKLYHTLNNDLDDYYFSVCSDFYMLPQNVVVVILALRNTFWGLHKHIKSQIILHKDLKESIALAYFEHLSKINDRTATLIINEYLRHIDDLYLTSSSSSNEKCFEFFFENQTLINKLNQEQESWTYDDLNPINRKYLFDHKHKTELISILQKRVMAEMDESFFHFLELSGRGVSGNSAVPYFRGSGSSYSLIRYQLDYQSFYQGDSKTVSFKVWLSRSVLDQMGIDNTNDDFAVAFHAAEISCCSHNAPDWELVFKGNFQPENAIIYEVIKHNLTDRWLDLEDFLGREFDKYQTGQFYNKLRDILQEAGYNIEDHDEGLVFTMDEIDFTLKYKVAFVAPDYTEIILYGNIHQWNSYQKIIESDPAIKTFILFDNYQAGYIPELRDDRGDSVLNFEALIKRSFREKDHAKALTKFEEEMSQFSKLVQRLSDRFVN